MNQQETIEYNRRCAELLGKDKKGDDVTWTFPSYLNGRLWVDEHFFNNDDDYCGRRQTEIHELKFHTDWNWIMEVVEKIESLAKEEKVKNWSRQNKNIFDFKLTESKKEVAIEAINQFLTWYNANK